MSQSSLRNVPVPFQHPFNLTFFQDGWSRVATSTTLYISCPYVFREYWKGLYRGECTDICASYFTTPIPNYTPLGTPLGIQNFTHRHTATRRRATKEDVLIIITAAATAAVTAALPPAPAPPIPPALAHKGQFDEKFSQLEKIKVGFFSESVIPFSNIPISKRKIFQTSTYPEFET